MMKTFNQLFFSSLLLVVCSCLMVSCVDEEEYPDTRRGNFEALWRMMDEKYCFFEYKKEQLGVDWQEIYRRYAPQIDESMSQQQLFEVLTNMLGELKDGHVNLYSSFDVGRNWSWHEDYPANISDTLINRYLGRDFRIATGMRYRILDDNVGYIRCSSFAGSLGAGNLDEIFMYLIACNGLIIDLRSNPGGMVTSAEELAARFTNESVVVGYMRHKRGKGHQDFSELQEQVIKPGRGMRWQKKVVVLTNRSVYSAANEFVKYMKCFPNVIVVGDRTGGGAGMPFSGELPNGWGVRFSAVPMYDRDKKDTEFGITPHYRVDMQANDVERGEDSIIEYARKLLK